MEELNAILDVLRSHVVDTLSAKPVTDMAKSRYLAIVNEASTLVNYPQLTAEDIVTLHKSIYSNDNGMSALFIDNLIMAVYVNLSAMGVDEQGFVTMIARSLNVPAVVNQIELVTNYQPWPLTMIVDILMANRWLVVLILIKLANMNSMFVEMYERIGVDNAS